MDNNQRNTFNQNQENLALPPSSTSTKPLAEQKIPETPIEFLAFVDEFVTNTAAETQKAVERTTAQVGETLESFSQNSLVKTCKNVFGLQWLMSILGEVDIDKIEAKLARLRAKYPDSTPEELANQVILDKAWEAGKVGLVSNIIPPVAVAMLGIELALTTRLQSEMVYEIAGVYGLDLREPARRGEVLAIFGISLGTDALKTGFSLIEIIPGIGAVVGASTNAIILYALGYTACRFYEGKYKYFSPTITTEKMTTPAQEKQRAEYWESALAQSRIMDEILAHMILASYPDGQSWEEILRTLEKVSPSSVKVVATKLENPQPLDVLLEQLSADFASLTLTRCYYFAQLDNVITPEEKAIIDAIAFKFNLDSPTFGQTPINS